jgi:probable HAF family extracellular repeat protein
MLTAVRTLFPFSFSGRAALEEPREYRFAELGLDEAGAALVPVALNDAGEICAASHREGGLTFGWRLRGDIREPVGSAMCHHPAAGLSSDGRIAGTAGATLRELRAWSPALGAFGEKHWPGATSYAHGINARGEIAGDVWSDAGEFGLSRAFVRTAAGSVRLLTPPHGGTSFATAINDAGDIAVNSTPLGASRDESRAWLLREQCYVSIQGLGGRRAWATALTPRGRVAGRALTADGATRAFLWDDGTITDLGTIEGGASEALAANDARTVVGRIVGRDGARRAFRWTPDTGMKWLDELTDLPRGWRLLEAAAVNQHGTIIGTGLRRGKRRGFVLRLHDTA